MVETGPSTTIKLLTSIRNQFPSATIDLTTAQCCRDRVDHKYMLATGGGALYIAFIGTKELRDVAIDITFAHQPLPFPSSSSSSSSTGLLPPTVHRGFLSRTHGIPIESLFLHARNQGLRLVICGHSLGGAVAMLTTLRLLSTMHASLPPTNHLQCICFGTPALGNESLAQHVDSLGWNRYFKHYVLPEDPVPKLLLYRKKKTMKTKKRDDDCLSGKNASIPRQQQKGDDDVDDTNASMLDVDAIDYIESIDAGAQTQTNISSWIQGAKESIISRTAGMPFLFHHFEDLLYLQPDGVSQSSLPTLNSLSSHSSSSSNNNSGNTNTSISSNSYSTTANKPTDTATTTTNTSTTRSIAPPHSSRGWLVPHRMWSYRARVLDICTRYYTTLSTSTTTGATTKHDTYIKGDGAPPIGMMEIMPSIKIENASASMPILWNPSSFKTSMNTRDKGVQQKKKKGRISIPKTWQMSSSTQQSNHQHMETTKSRLMLPHNNSMHDNSMSLSTLPLTYPIDIYIQGRNLDLCTDAEICLGHGVIVPGKVRVHKAKENVIARVGALYHPSSSSSHEDQPGKKNNNNDKDNNDNTKKNMFFSDYYGVVVTCQLPTDALLLLKPSIQTSTPMVQKKDIDIDIDIAPSFDSLHILLYTDFEKTGLYPIKIKRKSAWMMALDPGKGVIAMDQLLRMNEDDARVAKSAFVKKYPQNQNAQLKTSSTTENTTNSTTINAGVSNKGSENSAPMLTAMALVRGGVEVVHISDALQTHQHHHIIRPWPFATSTSTSTSTGNTNLILDQLKRAAILLQWKAQHKTTHHSKKKKETEVDHEIVNNGIDWNELQTPPIPPPEQIYSSSPKNSRHAYINRLWGWFYKKTVLPGRNFIFKSKLMHQWGSMFESLPHPDVVVLVVDEEDILVAKNIPSSNSGNSRKTNSNSDTSAPNPINWQFKVDIMDAIHAVAAAAAACRASFVLGVDSVLSQDAVFRRHLSYSCGLHGRPGVIIPMQLLSKNGVDDNNSNNNNRFGYILQSAIAAHANSDTVNTKDMSLDSIYRARL